jgi:Spy/CpxP family protein refolding chaperone
MKNSIMLAMALMISTLIFAQERHRDPQQMAARQTERMKENLALNDSQYASVKKINETYADKFASVRKDDTTTDDKRTALKTIHAEHEQAINAVLTPDQQKKWQTLKEERKAEKKAHKQHRHEHHKERLKTALSLSEDQTSRIETINKDFKEKLRVVKNDKNISENEKKSKIETLKKDHENTVKTVLTDDQFTKWKELKEARKHKGHKRR